MGPLSSTGADLSLRPEVSYNPFGLGIINRNFRGSFLKHTRSKPEIMDLRHTLLAGPNYRIKNAPQSQ